MNDRAEKAALADGVLVVVTAIWGASFVVVQDAVRLADPFTFLVLRFIVGASVLTVRDWRALADRRLLRAVRVHYVVFDLLALDGEDQRGLTYVVRRARLERLSGDWRPPLEICPSTADRDEALRDGVVY